MTSPAAALDRGRGAFIIIRTVVGAAAASERQMCYVPLAMRWTKLNMTFDAEPNAPDPRVRVDGDLVVVRFFLNPFIWDDVEDEDEAEFVFEGVAMYRLGPTNDEGYYRGQCRFSKTGIGWGDFYELSDSSWETNFPTDRVIVSKPKDPSELRHYLFFFRDETFECIAQRYEFRRIDRGT